MIGASDGKQEKWNSMVTAEGGTLTGTYTLNPLNLPNYFVHYEKNKVMLAGEYSRLPVTGAGRLTGIPVIPFYVDQRAWYGMATYKVTDKFSAGVDWAASGRYDFNQFLYAKVEQHFIDGTELSYDTTLNPGGLKPNTKLTILKVGVSF
jgi:hypothetical protein